MIAHALVLLTLAADPAAAPAKAGPSAQEKEWRVTTSVDGKPVAGQPAKVIVEIAALEDFHVNEEYPLSFRSKESSGVTFAKSKFGRADGLTEEKCKGSEKDHCVARLPVAFTAANAGSATVEGTMAFSVCNAEKCLIKKVELAVPVDVQKTK